MLGETDIVALKCQLFLKPGRLQRGYLDTDTGMIGNQVLAHLRQQRMRKSGNTGH